MMPFQFEPPDPGTMAAIERYQKAYVAQQMAERKRVLAHAWLYCSCHPWFRGFGSDPPQLGCLVHGTVVIEPGKDGRIF